MALPALVNLNVSSPVFARALGAAQWCSLRIPCAGNRTPKDRTGFLCAACHACVLASETSCVSGMCCWTAPWPLTQTSASSRDATAELLSARQRRSR